MKNNIDSRNEIIICGVLCNNDIALAELLSRYSFHVKVLRLSSHRAPHENNLPGKLTYFTYDNILYVENAAQFFRECSKANSIISINGYYPSIVRWRKLIQDLFFCTNFKKIINLTCGSDITELCIKNSLEGFKYRIHLKNSFYNYISPYPWAIKNLHKIFLRYFSFYRFNFFLLYPKVNKKLVEKDVIFFHPSNLDWGVNDSNLNRNSTKGNDRFLKAFIRALGSGLKARCILLDRGPDAKEAKKIINESGYASSFEFLSTLTPHELKNVFIMSDMVVDQFDVGGLGGIACEAMAQAKPVMIYIDKNCWPLVYDEEPPVINCHTEDEIYNAILEWSDKKKLQDLGEKAEKWVRKYHDVHTADFSEFILRVCLAAGLEWPRKDLAKQDS
jgi:glycosyltransferase involved in cell wall biosynthesis